MFADSCYRLPTESSSTVDATVLYSKILGVNLGVCSVKRLRLYFQSLFSSLIRETSELSALHASSANHAAPAVFGCRSATRLSVAPAINGAQGARKGQRERAAPEAEVFVRQRLIQNLSFVS